MVNVFSILCVSALFLSNLAAGASTDRYARRLHHDAARINSIQRRAAEAHHAALLANPAKRSSGSARKRANGRCKPRTSTSSLAPPATTSTVPATTPTHSTTQAIGNPGGDPKTTSKPETSAKPTTHHTTSTTKKAEKPTTTHKAATTTKASNNGGGGGSGGGGSGTVFHGDGTYYGVGLGSCGWDNTDDDMIVAVSKILYDNWPGATANPNNNPICGRYAVASYGGKSVKVKVVDRCVGCAEHDLDFSPAAFTKIADQALGRIQISWQWA